MSIVNSYQERVFLDPKPYATGPVRSSATASRYKFWLKTKRFLDMSDRELAAFVKSDPSTVSRGCKWAREEEFREEERAVEAMQPPVLDADSGLDIDDVLYLIETYPPDSDLGSLPGFRRVLEPLLERYLASLPPEAQLFTSEAA